MTLSVTRDGAVAVLTLGRPAVMNAFDDDLGSALLGAVQEASDDAQTRCIVITGSGRAFSAGEDLGALSADYEAGRAPDLGDTLVRRYNPLIRAIVAAPKPVVAAVNGVAAGAGASLSLACDHRIASERARFVLAFVNAGLVPDSGALWFLARIVGMARAWDLASSGRVVGAEEALGLGLFHEVLSEEGFEEGWRSVAQRFAAGPTRAYASTKSLLLHAASASLDEQLDREVDAQTEAGRTADHLEGTRAFLEKRHPRFTGS